MQLGAVILAAGGSTRFGNQPKLLADLDGRPVLDWAIGAASAVPELERIVVVLGGDADLLLAGVDFARTEPIVCPEWQAGLARSLRCGVAALEPVQRVMVLLGDHPMVTPELLLRFVRAPAGSRAGYGGVPGHPVVLGPAELNRLEELQGDRGARELLTGGRLIECGDIASGADIDTVADLDRLRTRRSRPEASGPFTG